MSLALERPPNSRLSLTQLFYHYGLDTAMYFESNIEVAMLLSGVFMSYFVFVVVFGIYDQGLRWSNDFIMVRKLATGRAHEYTWCMLILFTLVFFWICKLERMNWDYEQRLSPMIEDFSFVLYNIPAEMATDDVIEAVDELSGKHVVKSFLRVRNPSILRLRLKFIKLEKQYYERLMCNTKILYEFEKKRFNLRESSFWLRFTEYLGINRDGAYYEKKMSVLQDKIESKIKSRKAEKEGIIISVDSVGTKCRLLEALQHKKLVVDGISLSFKKACCPSDMNYPNISVNGRKRIWVEILNYIVLVLVALIVFFVTSLTRDITDKSFNRITSPFGRFCVRCLLIGLIMEIPFLFEQVIMTMVLLEREMLNSKRDRSLVIKLFLLKFVSKMTIIYSTDFSSMVLHGKTSISSFLSIFSKSSAWRVSLDGTGADLLIMASLSLLFDGGILYLFNACYRWYAEKVAISEYDEIVAENGAKLKLELVNAEKLVIITLCFAFGFEEPWLLPIGIVYLVIMAYLIRYILVRMASKPSKTDKMCVLFERIESIVVCGCIIAELQYDFSGMYAWIIFFAIAVLLNILLNTDIFNRFISRTLKLDSYYNAEKYKIQNCKMYDSYFFDERYEIAQSLSEIEIMRMHKLMESVKQSALDISDCGRSSVSVRGQDWAKSKFEFSDAIMDGDDRILSRKGSSSDVHELSRDFLRLEEEL